MKTIKILIVRHDYNVKIIKYSFTCLNNINDILINKLGKSELCNMIILFYGNKIIYIRLTVGNSPELLALRYYTRGTTPLEFIEVQTVARYTIFRPFFSHRFFFVGRDLNGL